MSAHELWQLMANAAAAAAAEPEPEPEAKRRKQEGGAAAAAGNGDAASAAQEHAAAADVKLEDANGQHLGLKLERTPEEEARWRQAYDSRTTTWKLPFGQFESDPMQALEVMRQFVAQEAALKAGGAAADILPAAAESSPAPSSSPPDASPPEAASASASSLAAQRRDPAVRRVQACFEQPDKYAQRFARNWSTLTRMHSDMSANRPPKLVHNNSDGAAASAAAAAASADGSKSPTKKRAREESDIEPPAAAAAARARNRQLLAMAGAAAAPLVSPSVARASKLPPPILPPTAIRRKKPRRSLDPLAAMRPSSCPPVIQSSGPSTEAREKERWPDWFAQIASPRTNEQHAEVEQQPAASPEGAAARKVLPTRFSYDVPASALPSTGEALPTEGMVTPIKQSWPREAIGHIPEGVSRPTLGRSATAGHAISWLSASAPSTPANMSGYRELGLAAPASHGGAAAATTDTVASALFAVPAAPRSLALMSPALPSGSTSSAVGSRPTPLLLPSTSSTSAAAFMSPINRPLSASATGASPRFGDSVPRFSETTLQTSILSSSTSGPPAGEAASAMLAAVSAQRGPSMMSPVQRPHGTPLHGTWPANSVPMSPLARQVSTPLTGGAGGAAGSLLAEWRALGATYVESVLRPPKLAELAAATRKPVATHAAALARFGPASAEASVITMHVPSTPHSAVRYTPATTPAVHAAAAAAGSMPPPMSPLPGRRASFAHPSLPPQSPALTGSMQRALSEQMSTPTHRASGSLSAGGSAQAGSSALPVPMSPNVTRMMSSYHATPSTPARSITGSGSGVPSAQQTPMSPLGLAQSSSMHDVSMLPPLARQASSSSSTGAVGPSPTAADAAVAAAAAADVPDAVPAVALAHPHTTSRVGREYQSELPALLTRSQRDWEHSVYMHAHAAVHGFPRHLPPMPSGPPPPAAAPTLEKQPSSSTSTGGLASPGDAASSSAAAAAAASPPPPPSSLPSYVPVPRVFPPPFALPAFPASASLTLVGRHTALREKMMGSRRAARRKREKEELELRRKMEESGYGRGRGARGAAANGAAGAAGTAGAAAGLSARDTWLADFEESLREAEAERTALRHGRDARRRNRDQARTDGFPLGTRNDADTGGPAVPTRGGAPFRTAHPSFASFASLFPADSPFSRMRFDDDTLSPYFVCSAFVRPHSPRHGDPRQRSFSPVHVLSVPPTPNAGPRRANGAPPDLSRFPSSLLSPGLFNRRLAALSSGSAGGGGGADELYCSEEDIEDVDEEAKREQELLTLQLRRARALAASAVAAASVAAAADEDAELDSYRAPAQSGSRSVRAAPRPAGARPASASGRDSSTAKPPRAAPGSGSASAKQGLKRKGAPSPSPSPQTVFSAGGTPSAGAGGRYKRWKMVSGKRIVWWVDAHGNQLDDEQLSTLQPSSEEMKVQAGGLPPRPPAAASAPRAAASSAAAVAAAAASASSMNASDYDSGEEDVGGAPGGGRASLPGDARSVAASEGGGGGGRRSRNDRSNDAGAADDGDDAMSEAGSDAHSSVHPGRIIIKRSVVRRNNGAAGGDNSDAASAASGGDSTAYRYHSATADGGAARSTRGAPTSPSSAGGGTFPSARSAAGGVGAVKTNLSDLSPAVRVSAARSGALRMIERAEQVIEEEAEAGGSIEETMERVIGTWRGDAQPAMA